MITKSKLPKQNRITATILHTELRVLRQTIAEQNYGTAKNFIDQIVSRLDKYDWNAIRQHEREAK